MAYSSEIGMHIKRWRRTRTREQYARQLGITPRTLYNYERNASSPPVALIDRICEVEGVEITQFFAGVTSSYSDEFVYIPRLRVEASAGYGSNVESEYSDGRSAYRRSYFISEQLDPKSCQEITVRGDSMSPTLEDGDSVLIDLRTRSHLRNGVYLFRYDSGTFIKRLQFIASDRIRVISDNRKYDAFDIQLDSGKEFGIIGRGICRSGNLR